MNRDAIERQRAFTALLAHPVLDRWRHPEIFAIVRNSRHRRVLTSWFEDRLRYRLVVTDSAARLLRLPLGGNVVAPRRYDVPPRRVLVLATLAAAAAGDTEDITTTQDLSDRVRALTGYPDVDIAPYEPDRFTERALFVKAVGLLVSAGALRPADRDDEERREGWAHNRDAAGGAYVVERELLLRLVDPGALDRALAEPPYTRTDAQPASNEPTSRYTVMRRLIELPVCLWQDLDEPEHAYLSSQRHRILTWCTEMTGWVVEQRAEGLALVAAEENGTDLPFPRLRAVDFATLLVLDELRQLCDSDGIVDDDQLDRAAATVRFRHPKAMTKELTTDLAVRERAVELLRALDLLRPDGAPGQWWLSPASARFRNPRVVSVTRTLDETEEG